MPLGNLRFCYRCLDIPQEQLRSIILPQDPVPVVPAQPEMYADDSIDYIGAGVATISPRTGIPIPSTAILGGADTTQALTPPTVGPNLRPNSQGYLNPSSLGIDPNAQMTPVKDVQWAQRIPVTSIVSNGTPTLTINCSAPHGLTTGAQIAMWGTTNSLAYGIFSITVSTATVFTCQANANVPSGNLIESSTIIQTTNAGLPWSVTQVPQTGL